ncbi:MAG: biopolymer transporter ExbD [Bernardetiaceae bacterium]|nr:biopolymer transporter ExbD [Bernardetiaceae bacterium]
MIKGKNKINPTLNVSSMTDIIFLLLIFFILTYNFSSQQAIPMQLPKSESGKTINPDCTIQITQEGNFFVEGQATQEDMLDVVLESFLENKRKGEGSYILIKADKNIPLEKALRAIDASIKQERAYAFQVEQL